MSVPIPCAQNGSSSALWSPASGMRLPATSIIAPWSSLATLSVESGDGQESERHESFGHGKEEAVGGGACIPPARVCGAHLRARH